MRFRPSPAQMALSPGGRWAVGDSCPSIPLNDGKGGGHGRACSLGDLGLFTKVS